MKVLHVISTLRTGGAQRLIADLLPIMGENASMAVLVNVLEDMPFEHALIDSGVDVLSIDCKKLYSPLNVLRIRKYIKQFDLIHVHLFPSLYIVAFANMFLHKPLIYTEHSTYNSRRSKRCLRPLEQFVYGRYSKIISISDLTQINLKSWLGIKSCDRKYVVVNNGVNLLKFQTVKHNINEQFHLIMVSRFAESKDQATVIRALTLLNDNTRLILVGDGPKLNKCKELAKNLGVYDRVDFVGAQSDIPNWLSKADIGIQSSVWEGFGLTAVEMMAAGIPVIATNVDGLQQVVEGAGEIFPVGNEKTLAEIVKHLLSDSDYYESVAEKCKERAKKYDIRLMADAYMDVYKQVLNHGWE